MRLLKFGSDTQEFLDVLGAALGLHGALGAESLQQARLIDNHLDNVLELAVHAATLAHQRHKARQAVAHLGAKHARLGCCDLAGLEERAAVVACQLLNLLDRGGADAAARRVDDALDAHLVCRVHDHLEVGHDVADLGTVEESRAAHNLVGHACAQEHIFEDTRLGVGAVEHSDIVVTRALGVQLFDLAGNPAALVALIACLEGLDLLAVALGRKQALLLALRVVTHHGVGGAQDMARGAVVLLQLNGLAVFKVLLKVQDVGDVGAAPAINGLVIVAYDHEVLVLGGQQVGDLVLDVVGVLILVDANVAETLLVLIEHLGAGAQQFERAHEQVVEVHRIGGAQAALQFQVDLRGLFVVGAIGTLEHVLGADHGVFGRTDLAADHIDGELLLLDTERLHNIAHHALGIVVIVDGELTGVAQQVSVLAQHAHAHSMEGAHPHAAGTAGDECRQTLAHLGRGLVGKRDGKDLPGLNTQVAEHMCDAEGQDAGLARAGAGKDQQRTLGGQDRLALGGIKAVDVDERLGGLGRRRGSVVDVERNELGLRRSRGGVCIERYGFRRGRHGYRGVLFPGQGLGHGRLLI